MLYLIYKIGIFILHSVTTESAYAIICFFAKAQYLLSKKDRRIVKKNLVNVLPGADKKEISRLSLGVFQNFSKYLVDFFSLMKHKGIFSEGEVRIEGIENLEEALKSGRGCIIMTGHFGNWELAGCAFASRGFKLNAITLAHLDPRINSLFINLRTAYGIKNIHAGSARAASQKALQRNEAVAILGDRPFGDRGIEATFFGKKAVFPRGAALLSLKNDSPIITCFCFKEDPKKNSYTIRFDRPFTAKKEGDLRSQLQEITQRFADRFEYYIRKYPSQWYMFNEVWKD